MESVLVLIMKLFILITVPVSLVGGFAPSIDMPTTPTEPTTTTEDPATLPFIFGGGTIENATAIEGSTTTLKCQVLRLGDRTVSWMKRLGGRLDLLTFGLTTYHSDDRYALLFVFPNIWSLQINSVRKSDDGIYECQISTHPPTKKTIRLNVKVPRVDIREVGGQVVREKFYEVGSSIDLECAAVNVPPETRLTWSKGPFNLSQLSHFNKSAEIDGLENAKEGQIGDLKSRLHISAASSNDTGNYSCHAQDVAASVVKLHVLQGEDSVAMQHSINGANQRPFSAHILNTGLLLLTLNLLFSQ